MLTVLSLGAGVQSTALLLMAAADRFEVRPDVAIFADTGWEPQAVYDHLAWLEAEVGDRIPIHRVAKGNLRTDSLKAISGDQGLTKKQQFVTMPLFIQRADGQKAMLKRNCTQDYKLEPIRQKIRELLGQKRPPPNACEVWIGISLDEALRMKPSRVQYITNRWPLIERRLSRHDCIQWLEQHHYPTPPRSACIACPFNGDHRWRQIQQNPAEWADALAFDEAIRHSLPHVNRLAYLHASTQPLAEVDFRTAAEHGQTDLFDNECEGLCGV